MESNSDKNQIFIMGSMKLNQVIRIIIEKVFMAYKLIPVEWIVRIFHLMNENSFEQMKLAVWYAGDARALLTEESGSESVLETLA